jgi:aldehyde dehydrogenase (NAD+)
VFGPCVTVTRFKEEDEALRIANASTYGLGGGLWTSNLTRAHRLAREIRSGMVWVNCYKRFSPASRLGRRRVGLRPRNGFETMHEYIEAHAVWVNVDANIPAFYKR